MSHSEMRAASLRDASQLESTIRVIESEMIESEHRLQREQQSYEENSARTRDLEPRVSELRRQYEELYEENSEYHRFISEKCKEKEQYECVAVKLEELAAQIADRNNEYRTGANTTLPEEERLQVEAKVDEVVRMAFAEYCHLDSNEYQQEIERLQAELDELDDEIDILSEIKGEEWCPKRPAEIRVKEFCKRYPKVVTESHESLSTIEMPVAETPTISEGPVQVVIPEAPDTYEVKSLDRNMAPQNNMFIRTYQEQYNFLGRLRELIEQNESEQGFNPVKFREQLHQKIRMMQEIGSIDPVQIPTQADLAESVDPVEVLATHFGKFCDELDKLNSASGSLAAGLEKAAEETLSMPKFVTPPKPRYIKNPTPSPQLTQLSKQLAELSEVTKQCVPVQAIQSITASHRELLQAKMDPVTPKDTLEIPVPSSLPEISDLDMTSVEQFKELAISKFPALAARFSSPGLEIIAPPIEKACEEAAPPEAAPIDIGVETHIQERSAIINNLLRQLYNMDIPPVANIVPTPTITETYEPIDTTPLLNAIDEVLSPTRLSADVLKDEIGLLERKLAELRQEAPDMVCEDEINEGEIEELRQRVEMIKSETKELNDEVQAKFTILKELRERDNKIKSENENLEKQIEMIDDVSEQVTKMEIEVKEKRAELLEKQRDFEEEKNALLSLRSESNAQ